MKPSTLRFISFSGLCFVAVALALGVFPEWALGAEGGEVHHKEFSVVEEGFKFVNTLIVVLILYKLLAKPLANFFKDRREGITAALAEAKAARLEAEGELEAQRSKVADLEAELGRVRETGERERGEIGERIEVEQKAQADRLLEQTRGAIELETSKARAELQARAAELAMGLAEEMLKKNIGPEDQERFVSEYLVKLGDQAGGNS
ncbi:MAG: F0F1 ATP synthase subunit B [Nitrospinaceae bacterium]|nr:F0F1 ATP synthase subunit B [Nitrospinaceae bacterium]